VPGRRKRRDPGTDKWNLSAIVALADLGLKAYSLQMSSKARSILKEILALPVEDQQIVCKEILQLDARREAWEQQRAKLRAMQTRHAGRGLLNRLLEERAKERARG
jgi:hypothetical protein